MFSCCKKSKVAPNALTRPSSSDFIGEPTSGAKQTGEAKGPLTEPTSRAAEFEKISPSASARSLGATQPESHTLMPVSGMSYVESPAPPARGLSEVTSADYAPKISYRNINAPRAATPISAWPAVPVPVSQTAAAYLAPGSISTSIPFAVSVTATAQAVTPTHSTAIPASSLSSGVMGPLSSSSGLPSGSPSGPTTTPPSDISDSHSLGPNKSP